MDIKTKNCSNCFHKRVCSLKDKYTTYQNEMKELIAKWGEDNPFGFTTNCPEWHICMDVSKEEYKPKSDLDMWIEQERNLHPSEIKKFKETPKVTYDFKTDDLELDTKVMKDIKDEIMATKAEETKETKYDFVKALEDIMKQNGVWVIK